VNRAGEKLKKENGLINDLDIGYKVFSLTDKPSVDENFALLHPRAGVAEKLYNMLVATNKPLHAKIEIIEENALYRVENSFYAIDSFKTDIETLKDFEIYIDAYSTINLEKYLNLDIINRENIRVVY
jgi:adenine-specific DNA-methyltransferase